MTVTPGNSLSGKEVWGKAVYSAKLALYNAQEESAATELEYEFIKALAAIELLLICWDRDSQCPEPPVHSPEECLEGLRYSGVTFKLIPVPSEHRIEFEVLFPGSNPVFEYSLNLLGKEVVLSLPSHEVYSFDVMELEPQDVAHIISMALSGNNEEAPVEFSGTLSEWKGLQNALELNE